MSECTSPSSASSSRDPSEAMSECLAPRVEYWYGRIMVALQPQAVPHFLELIGFRRRTVGTSSTSLLPATKPILKKRKRRVSEDETGGLYANIDNSNTRPRQAAKPPRPVSYYPVEDSDDSDNLRTKRKATSFLNVHNKFDNTAAKFNKKGFSENLLRVERETKLRHDKENLEAENRTRAEMRNQRLVEQLREKSAQFSKLQFHAHKLDEQIESLSQRCALNAALDKLTLEERFIEDRLRQFQRQVQSAKLDVANAQQKTMNNIAHERSAHQACLDRLEDLQRENFALMQSRYLESGCDDSVWQRKIDALPAYEALYSFAQHAVRKYSDLRWMLLEREREASRAELDLIAAQSSIVIACHTCSVIFFENPLQNERFRIKLGEKRRPKRPASFHGEDLLNRV
ncbi:hypothetical protein OSTOST_17865, partial [Ostertagia ostertagi]